LEYPNFGHSRLLPSEAISGNRYRDLPEIYSVSAVAAKRTVGEGFIPSRLWFHLHRPGGDKPRPYQKQKNGLKTRRDKRRGMFCLPAVLLSPVRNSPYLDALAVAGSIGTCFWQSP